MGDKRRRSSGTSISRIPTGHCKGCSATGGSEAHLPPLGIINHVCISWVSQTSQDITWISTIEDMSRLMKEPYIRWFPVPLTLQLLPTFFGVAGLLLGESQHQAGLKQSTIDVGNCYMPLVNSEVFWYVSSGTIQPLVSGR